MPGLGLVLTGLIMVAEPRPRLSLDQLRLAVMNLEGTKRYGARCREQSHAPFVDEAIAWAEFEATNLRHREHGTRARYMDRISRIAGEMYANAIERGFSTPELSRHACSEEVFRKLRELGESLLAGKGLVLPR